MSIKNKGNRRLSMGYFAGLFLLGVFLCCTAFVRTMKKTTDIPKQELALLMEKEEILFDFAELSKALCQFDDSKRANAKVTHKNEAAAKTKKVNLYQKLLTKDTVRIYNDVLSFMKMADQYYYLIDQMGEESDERMKVCNQELTNLRKQNELLLTEKNQILAEKSAIELEKLGMKNQLALKSAQAPKMPKSSGGGSSQIIPNTPKNCAPELSAYKAKMASKISLLQNEIQQIRSSVNGISGSLLGSKKKVDKKKKDIITSITRLEEKIDALLEN